MRSESKSSQAISGPVQIRLQDTVLRGLRDELPAVAYRLRAQEPSAFDAESVHRAYCASYRAHIAGDDEYHFRLASSEVLPLNSGVPSNLKALAQPIE